ncbi:MAG: ATP synthase F1 subunit epsilon [Candidatus Pacebacteria bacterium]|nr:ATP synthase F1 subunit epsilon [Candidatus Paceibacterota bacterium]
MKNLTLRIVSQEKQLLETETDSVSIPTVQGQITVLPGHLPLFAQVQTGELIYRFKEQAKSVVVTKGFVDVTPKNEVVVMVDSGTLAEAISVQQAQQAIQAAHETMQKTQDQRELILAEAALRKAMWEIRVAEKTKKSQL